MAANLKELFQSLTAKIAEKINALDEKIGNFEGGGGISADVDNELSLGTDDKAFFKERTPEEIASAYESVEGVQRFTPTLKATYDSLTASVQGKADLDPETGKLKTSQIPQLAITNVVSAAEATLADFILNVNTYEFDEGDAIVIPTVNESSEIVKQSYLYNGGDRSLESSYVALFSEIIQPELTPESIATALEYTPADDSEVVKSISVNGGEPQTPVEGLVDLEIESLIPNEHQINGLRVDADVTTNYAIDWNTASLFNLTMTAATDFTDANLPTGANTRIITMILTGDFAFTVPAYWKDLGGDAYDGTLENRIQIECINGTAASEKVFYTIQNIPA